MPPENVESENSSGGTDADAVACYILSRRQGIEMISVLFGKPEKEIEQLIGEGRQILKRRQSSQGRS